MQSGLSLSRRSALRLLVPGAGAAILVACTGQAPAPSAPPTSAAADKSAGAAASATAKPAAAPNPGGTLRIGISAEPANVDGHIRTPGSDLTYWLAFDRLIDYDDKLQPQPGLAESWDVAKDYTSVTFHLRKGVTFHS